MKKAIILGAVTTGLVGIGISVVLGVTLKDMPEITQAEASMTMERIIDIVEDKQSEKIDQKEQDELLDILNKTENIGIRMTELGKMKFKDIIKNKEEIVESYTNIKVYNTRITDIYEKYGIIEKEA